MSTTEIWHKIKRLEAELKVLYDKLEDKPSTRRKIFASQFMTDEIEQHYNRYRNPDQTKNLNNDGNQRRRFIRVMW